MHLGAQAAWSHGVVVTSRYIRRCVRECSLPVVVDNGAFPAWRDGLDLSLGEQLKSIELCLEVAGSRVSRIIAPDIVGDAAGTMERIELGLDAFPDYHDRFLLPMQERCNTEELVALARALGAGLFIGGASKRWKIRQVLRVRELDLEVYIHVGRLSKSPELEQAVRAGANAFDTTTFMRRQDNNKRIDWAPRFNRFCKEAN